MLVKPEVADGREEGIFADFADRVARALEAGTEFLGVGVCREAWLLVALDKQRVVEHLLLGRATAVGAELLLVTPVDRALDVNPARVEQLVVGDPLFYSLIQLAVKRFS